MMLYIFLICLVLAVAGLFIGYCGGGSKPVPVTVKPIDPILIEQLNTRDREKKEAALQKIFEENDSVRELSDKKRAELKQEIIQDTKFGKRVTADDFRLLIEKAQGEDQKR